MTSCGVKISLSAMVLLSRKVAKLYCRSSGYNEDRFNPIFVKGFPYLGCHWQRKVKREFIGLIRIVSPSKYICIHLKDEELCRIYKHDVSVYINFIASLGIQYKKAMTIS